jgi:predicted RNA binding protein YcfA (HicA-like mRNA interferase family)
MPELLELSYPAVTRRLRKGGLRFYRRGKGSHELWVRDTDGRAVPVPRYWARESGRERCGLLSGKLG